MRLTQKNQYHSGNDHKINYNKTTCNLCHYQARNQKPSTQGVDIFSQRMAKIFCLFLKIQTLKSQYLAKLAKFKFAFHVTTKMPNNMYAGI